MYVKLVHFVFLASLHNIVGAALHCVRNCIHITFAEGLASATGIIT